ncbi:unnamed protein product, partial [Ixodes persulcatus]
VYTSKRCITGVKKQKRKAWEIHSRWLLSTGRGKERYTSTLFHGKSACGLNSYSRRLKPPASLHPMPSLAYTES